MRIADFDMYKDLLKEKSGLVLAQDQSYLLDSRLSPVAKKWGFPSLDAMSIALRGVPDKALLTDVIEAMTTRETSFFRHTRSFEYFKNTVLSALAKTRSGKKPIRIWCAGAASGQEPYTLAITLKEESAKLVGLKFEIVATDISNDTLELAREGIYSQIEVQRGLPINLLLKYFTQSTDKWQINADLRKMIKFQYLNLLDSFTGLGKFDVIFCRNVLSSFDGQTQREVLAKMAAQLEADGYLFLGETETLADLNKTFKPVAQKRGLYQRIS